ncbi:G8 domain-containing protein [Meiothermus sp.]|uniref:G8 domain-containing protein n=1 Tax=Meiothermus sp. TaxID=1955249 RepID=UPI0021DD5C1A|nr:G8 domain-containing protein [Meiothermus sp.]GIW24661.1 MAG: hypothetical protein KatS3mg069_0928 [Meiothermus sp.]
MKRWWSLLLIALLIACDGSGAGTNPSRTGRWSDPQTWPGGQVPRAGEVVTIPADLAVVLDVSPPPLKGINVYGILRFDDKDLELSADWIMVHGKLEVGTPERPFRKRAVITLTGNNPSENQMGMGTKVLGVMGGTLDLHGEPRKGWTKLAQTAPRGATQITVLDARDWRVGDRIVLASTDYNPHQAEVRTITALNGNTLTLDQPLQYPHFGQITFGVDQRGEVGLLSRNVVVQGDESSSTTGFGGHIMGMIGSTLRVSGVELFRMGQLDQLARYPFHWHLMGQAPGQYIKNSSIHQSFNRCVTIHGTSGVEVVGNVAYDNLGHCYFLEDGAETKNLLQDNLGILTRKPDPNKGQKGVIPTDRTPATFWITHPDNIVRNNVAAGSDHTGFWYALPEHPTGPSATLTVWPRRTPLGEFSGNVSHSSWDGLMVDRGPNQETLEAEPTIYNPRTNPADTQNQYDNTKNPPVVAVFQNHTAYKHRGNAIWLRGTNHKVVGAKLADNAIGVTFASWETTLEDSLVVGDTDNKGYPESWEFRGVDGRSLPRPWAASSGGPIADNFPIRGFEFYDGKVGFRNVEFVNFQPLQIQNAQGSQTATREAGALSYLRFTAFDIDSRNFAEGARFTNAKPVYLPPRPEPTPEEVAEHENADGYRGSVFIDADGSVGGSRGYAIVLNHPFLLDTNCNLRAEWNASICNYSYGRLHILNESGGDIAPVSLTRQDGSNPVFRMWGAPNNLNFFGATVIKNRSYALSLTGAMPSKLKLRFADSAPGDFITLTLPYSGEPSIYRDYWIDNRNKLPRAASKAEFDSSNGDRYWSEGGRVFVKLVVRDQPGRDWAVLDICANDLCR